MLNSQGFDLWADGYDQSVGLSEEKGTYPFAGYKDVLNKIYIDILSSGKKTVLDIGFGTATLTAKLYERGCEIYGQDFSRKMLEIAQPRMPRAKLYCGDFAKGLVEPLTRQKYDAIIATYSLHHLTDAQKVDFIHGLLPLLNDHGCVYLGDVAFATRAELQKCRELSGDEWDDDEIYLVYEELRKAFPKMTFERMSYCSGVLCLEK